ncbi:acetolactate synthase 3 large subunit [Pelagibacterales bacterium]|jgi:acetolactate synthase-1/2/3 large subunit|nr:acetolactate synthase 3 large subunit [Pelagibacterales bacterium]MDA9137100.1 acetolactate synthase 3 large subunit [Pelagibacterales bacterium]MDA9864646.1 acetolactate synthase 3 large subunit [Pelagibacterales bacterium]MDA9980943.1 acetolactate synthase 3 large subunit [Pelagibacterales bacterium]MDB4220383.1 acetolactate synthase 3 large subunit [Pelagibacterales bacterium]|tara:strand:- start:2172 stop:3932 length:1761 start_codon:yes stop_codon:yes gene_type:complete
MVSIQLTGAEMVLQAFEDHKVDTLFGYPGGAVLPIYDELAKDKNSIHHYLVRHEQGAAHAAEGYARASGKVGVFLVTSGPGVTNAVTGLADAMMDSIPLVCISGQVPSHLIGTDAFQECDAVGITRPCTKHNWLVKDINDLSRILHEAFYIAASGRPGPVLVDIPKDIQFQTGTYIGPETIKHKSYRPKLKASIDKIDEALKLIVKAQKPVFYTGGGVINSGNAAVQLLREFVRLTGFPITSTLQGLGAFPGDDNQFIGMLGMHGTYEANMAMHDCDLLINIGARFDDRITGKVDEFSPDSKKIHVDIDPSSINKTINVDVPLVGDVAHVLEDAIKLWKSNVYKVDKAAVKNWWSTIEKWKEKDSLGYKNDEKTIKPQYAIQRLYELTKDKDSYITTEVGQHQMWAAQYYKFNKPNRWITSGGLGTMGFGLPAAIGAQVAHPDKLVIDIAGEASILMCIQEMSTAIQHQLPVKIFIINNQYMGMVRQWQELLHDKRYSHSYTDALPDFVKLAEAYGAKGIRVESPAELDKGIQEMIDYNGPVIFDCVVDQNENVYPMIPSGKAHNEMLLGKGNEDSEISDEGKVLV